MTVGSLAAAPVAGGPGLGARRPRARRAARRRRRASRSSRRRRRPCGRRPSAAGSRGRRSRASRCAARGRPRPRRRRTRCRPCRTRARCRRPRARPAGRRRPRRRRGPRARSRRRPAPPRPAGATPPEDLITSGSGSPRSRAASARRAEVAAEQGGEVGVDHRRRAALVLAKLRQHLVRGRDVDAGQLGAQALGDRALVRGVEVGEQQADRDRLGAGLARPRRPAASSSSVGERLDDALGPDALGGREPALLGDQRRRLRRAEAVEAGGGSGARSRAGR